MKQDRECVRSSQLDLFAWRERDDSSAEVMGHNALRRNMTETENFAAMTLEVLITTFESRFDDSTGVGRDLVPLIIEVGRRRKASSVPMLLRVCHRHAGFDRSRTVPEMVAALKALTTIKSPDAAPAVLRLVEQGALGHASQAAALLYFAAVRHRPAAGLLRPYLDHDDAEVRESACTLAAVIGTRSNIERLVELCNDTRTEVIDAALIALGHLRHRPIKDILESRLQSASINDIPRIVEALIPVSDDETAVCLGRLIERTSDDRVRCIVVEALAELDGGIAVNWLLRLIDDPCAEIRQVVAEALADRDDHSDAATPLSRCADADTNVGELAATVHRSMIGQ